MLAVSQQLRTVVARRAAVRGAAAPAMAARGMASDAGGEYDVVVVGGGPGGYVAAIKAAQLGLRTTCIESRGALGGTCLNVGCIPSKALLNSSHLYEMAQHDFKAHGINVSGVDIDVGKMLKHKNKAVRGLTGGIEFLFKKNGVDYVKGFGRFTGHNQVTVDLQDGGQQVVDGRNIIVATGSEVTPLPPCPVDNSAAKIVDSTGALDLTSVPERLTVVGGGVIGLELGSVWRRLGSQVKVIEFLDRIVPSLDREIGKAYHNILKKQGLDIQVSTKVVASEVQNGGDGPVLLTTEPAEGGAAESHEADVVLVSTGRRPFTQNMGLEELGVNMDRLGRVTVDDHFRSSVGSIYAIGDAIAGPMLAHKAEEEGIAAVEIIAGQAGHVNYDAIPNVIYTHPELATVGRTEEELKEAGVQYVSGSFPFQANSRARTVGDSEGLIKVLSDAETDRILGVHIIGPNAGEMIAEATLAMEYGASSEDIARTCHAHPTLSEALKEACMATYDKAIHF